MTVLTLLVKASSFGQLKKVEDMLKAEFENLDLDIKVLGNPVNRWIQVALSGEDEVIAKNYVVRQIGICPVHIKNVDQSSVLKGYVSKIDNAKQELKVDIGVFEPKTIQAVIPLTCLQAELADGERVDLKKISEIYGFCENLPLSVKVTRLSIKGEDSLEAELAMEQIEKIHLWQQSLLDRLIILGASVDEIEKTLERTRLNRDVIEIETLGLFEHALTCKLGTDAKGLIPEIGRYMRNAVFVVFNPKKSLGFMGEKSLK
jgi:hypothetical protein